MIIRTSGEAMLSEIQQLEQLVREADAVDADRTRLIREKFMGLLPLVGDIGMAKELTASFVAAHTRFEIGLAQGAAPALIEIRRRECLGSIAQLEREIASLATN